ncbi:MAG: hypothetical protein COT15_04995 [Candidatus Diapherotrites archaeon CG08_land_8_20_14_0_20_34_12]|nr:MAG: hypothetical protein COT15_04995 [Candidatus Diapherotrites archaeon CG08_land_8_20_14_0_20_34_12]
MNLRFFCILIALAFLIPTAFAEDKWYIQVYDSAGGSFWGTVAQDAGVGAGTGAIAGGIISIWTGPGVLAVGGLGAVIGGIEGGAEGAIRWAVSDVSRSWMRELKPQMLAEAKVRFVGAGGIVSDMDAGEDETLVANLIGRVGDEKLVIPLFTIETKDLDWCKSNEYYFNIFNPVFGQKTFKGITNCVGGDIQKYTIRGKTAADTAQVKNNWGTDNDLDDELIKDVDFYNGSVIMDYTHDTILENEIQVARLEISSDFINESIKHTLAKLAVRATADSDTGITKAETGMVKIDITSYVQKLQSQSSGKAKESDAYGELASAVAGMLNSGGGAPENFTAFVNSSIKVCTEPYPKGDGVGTCSYEIAPEVGKGKVFIKAYGLEKSKKYSLVIDIGPPYPNFKPKKAPFTVTSFDEE